MSFYKHLLEYVLVERDPPEAYTAIERVKTDHQQKITEERAHS